MPEYHDNKSINKPQYFRPYQIVRDVTLMPNSLLRYPGLSLGAKVIYCVLARFSNGKTSVILDVDRIAAETAVDRKTVIRATADLDREGFLEKIRRGKKLKNAYHFLQHPIFQTFTASTPDEIDEPDEVKYQKGTSLFDQPSEVPKRDRVKYQKGTSIESVNVSLSTVDNERTIDVEEQEGSPATRSSVSFPTQDLIPVRRAMKYYFEDSLPELWPGGHPKDPDEDIVSRVLAAAGGARAGQVEGFIVGLRNGSQRPGTANGPRSWGWFEAIVRKNREAVQKQFCCQHCGFIRRDPQMGLCASCGRRNEESA